MVPDVNEDGLLPPGRHLATLDEIREKFVKDAPFDTERSVVFSALELHFQIIVSLIPTGSLWVDGGFVTHKSWAAPKDADLAYILRSEHLNGLESEAQERLASLVTLQGVQVAHPPIVVPRIQPMGGLIDAFLILQEVQSMMDYWDGVWSTVKGEDGEIIAGARKGYLEVAW